MKTGISIAQLRYNLGLTQEEFADRIGVSSKTIRRWEAGTGIPNADNLVTISKEFSVSLDALLNSCMPREAEEHYKKIFPEKSGNAWENYETDLLTEYEQSLDEGIDIEKYHGLFTEVSKLPNHMFKKKLGDVLFDIVINTPQRDKYIYNEPSALDEIRCLRKTYSVSPKHTDLPAHESKIRGAWLGRICGCLLGKPIEGIRTKELNVLLKETGNYPMSRYILSSDITEELCQKISFHLKGKCWADTISCAPADDDTNYTVLASLLIEKYGKDFTPGDVLDMWLSHQQKDAYCTAERVAWRNYFNGYCPPNTALYKNPYREWIGAQIRGDYFGYICPGNPELAAELAWRDASVSHIKNGIYGEMLIAAMLALAAVTNDVSDVIRGGLARIPSTSRLYEDVNNILSLHDDGLSEEECRKRIHAKYNENTAYGWCHTNPNAMIVTMALLYHNDYGSAVCSAVQTGFDTDCNGATVGSVFGMLHGDKAIGEEWTKYLGGKLETGIIGNRIFDIENLIQTTMKHIALFRT